jgi:hypothetical protein
MDSRNKIARVAGLLYLFTVITGLFSLMFVPSRINANGDAALLVSNILASEQLFRLGIAAGALGYVAFMMLPLALHHLLSPINKMASVLMVAFATVQVPIYFVAIAKQLDALSLLDTAKYQKIFTPGELHASVMVSMDAYNNLLFVSEVFMGLWLLPFGYLVWKSGFLPKSLGALLMLGCFGYLADFFIRLLAPQASVPSFVMVPATLGEIGICLWLLIMGVSRRTDAAG